MKSIFGEGKGIGCVAILALVLAAFSVPALIADETGHSHTALPNFDIRIEIADNDATAKADTTAPQATAAAEAIKSRVRGTQVDRHAITRSPTFIRSTDKFLTGPSGRGGANDDTLLQSLPANDPHRTVKAFIDSNADLFGHHSDVISSTHTRRDYVTQHSDIRTIVLEQQHQGIPVFEATLQAHLTGKDELINISSSLLSDPAQAAQTGARDATSRQGTPKIAAITAVVAAARNIGETLTELDLTATNAPAGNEQKQSFHAPTLGDIVTSLTWLPMNASSLRLCWQVQLTSKTQGVMYRVLIDAFGGEYLVRHCLTDDIAPATYNVFTSDSPSPFSPGHATPSNVQPALISRTLVTHSALDTTASPNGWIDDGVMETRGNNVDAHTDIDADNSPDLPRPQATGTDRVFNPTLDLTQAPSTYKDAAVVNLFYWCNWMHDRLYQLGFTESAGNFQNNNFGRGGLGNDAVQADAQDGSGTNNANFSSPADGSPGRMQMFIFNYATPDRDGDFDAEIILHEYTHGLSNRLVGGGVGMSALQSRGMGEGWSDFYALALLSESTDDTAGTYPTGGYATHLRGGITENYYYGIRRYPYSTDLAKSPLTYKDIDPAQASAHTGVPRNTATGTTANSVHNMGEVWCNMLWDARVNLIAKHGHATGNELMLQLVTDGMKLAPANPTFVQARDAIIQADLVKTSGTNRIALWTGFAKRGLGAYATSPANSTTTGVVENYDLPDDLAVTPSTPFTTGGAPGGPFTPTTQTYTLTNFGTATLSWTAAINQTWATLDLASGSLTPGATTTITLSLNTTANALVPGTYNATTTITNTVSGTSFTRTATLTVINPPTFSSHPTNVTAYASNSFSLSGYATTTTGTITYQWKKDGVALVNSTGHISGATSTSLYVSNSVVSDSGSYTLVAYNGASAISNPATVTVSLPPPPSFVTQPSNQTVYATNSIYLSSYANSVTTSAYQWYKDGVAIPGATSSVYSKSSAATTDAGVYTLTVTNAGGSVTSSPATVTVNVAPAPLITSQSTSQTAYIASTLYLNANVTGYITTTYQWFKDGVALTESTRISGTTSAYLSFSALQASDAGTYTIVATNASGSTTSNPIVITITLPPLPVFTSSPSSSSPYIGATVNLYSYANTYGPATYQWFKDGVALPDLTGRISGATTNYLTIYYSQASDGGTYTIVVTNAAGSTTSAAATLTMRVPAAPTMSGQPVASTTRQAGNSLSLSAYATGDGNLTYQWYKDGVALVSDSRISYVTSSNLYISSTRMGDTGVYTCVISNAGGSVTSNPATVTITAPPAPNIYTQPGSSLTVTGGTTFYRTVYASGVEPMTYQWFKDGVALVNGGRISGATTYNIAITNAQITDAGIYTITITNEGGSVTSDPSTVTIVLPSPPTISSHPSSGTFLEGTVLLLSGSANSTAPITYQWYKDSTALSGGTSSSYTKTAVISDAGQYYFTATNAGGTATSNTATVTITPATAPTFTIHPKTQAVYAGDNLTLTAVATANPAATLQWFKNGTAISGATANTLALTALTTASDGDTYYVKATNIAGTATSDTATLSVYPANSTKALSLSPATRTVGCARVVYPLSLRTNADWTATISASWLSLSSTSGKRSRSLEVTVAPNPFPVERTATLTIGEKTHTVTQRAAGTTVAELWATGANDLGQLGDYRLPPLTLPAIADTDVATVSGGRYHTLYVKTDGTLWATGYNAYGQLGTGNSTSQQFPVQIATGVKAVAAGYYHTLFLKTDDTLWVCGLNSDGQLGTGNTTSRSTPVQIATDVTAIAAGAYHSAYVKTDGTLWVTGYNAYGQLGDGTTTSRSTPWQLATGTTALAAGYAHTLYVKTDTTLWATGYNAYGQLGDTTTVDKLTPVQTATGIATVAAGFYHSLLLTTDGTLLGMGYNGYGQLGNSSYASVNYPVTITTDATAATAGAYHTLIVNSAGILQSCGDGSYYKLGTGTTTARSIPITIASTVKAISCGRDTTFFVKTDNTLWAVGDNFRGQLGYASPGNETRTTPVCVASEIATASAGDNHTLFLKTDGTAWTVGDNSYGQLADGSTITRFEPANIATDIKALAAGYQHTLLLKTNGTLLGAGYNYYYQLGDGSYSNRPSPVIIADSVTDVAAGQYHSLFIKTAAKQLYGAGYNNVGQLGNGSSTLRTTPYYSTADVANCTAGGSHSLFLKTDATLWATGYNNNGQLGNGSTASAYTPIQIAGTYLAASAGYYHSLHLKSNNTAWSTGDNAYGQLGDATTIDKLTPVQVLTNVKAIATGAYHSLWLKNDNTLWASGDGSSGQLGNGLYSIRSTPAVIAANVQSATAGTTHTLILANGDIRTTVATPTISGVSPTPLTVGGQVTINGSNFNNLLGVSFNNLDATSYNVASSSQITAVVPSTNVTDCKIQVYNFEGIATYTPGSSSSSSSSSSGAPQPQPPAPNPGGGGGGGAPGFAYLGALVAAALARSLTLWARRR